MKQKAILFIVIAILWPTLLFGQSPKIVYSPVQITTAIAKNQLQQEDDGTISVVEQMPEYIGGEKALYKFIGENLKIPNDTLPIGKRPIVICRFAVEKDGSVSQISILKGLAPSFDEEALRILKMMPKWKPGKQGGKPVAIWYTLPIMFDNSYSKKKR